MSTRSAVKPQSPTRATPRVNVRTLVCLAMLTAIAYVVSYTSKLMPSVLGFLDFDLKDVIICIGGFTFGPVAAGVIAFASSLIQMFTVSTTGIIGFIMNFLATAGFCCTASFLYQRRHTMSGAVLGLVTGAVVMTVLMLLWNYFITPMYMVGTTREQVAAMLVPVFLPFNLVKAGMNTAATLLLYKPVVTALRRAHLAAPSESKEKSRVKIGFILVSALALVTFVMLMLVLTGTI